MFNLNEIDTTDRQKSSPYISYGSNQTLKINDIELKVSQNTGSPKAILHMETKPVEEEGFTPIEGAAGKVGKIAIGVYMKTDEQKKEFLKKLKMIGVALGLEDEINAIPAGDFEEIVEHVTSILSGNNKWARYTIFAEQYSKQDGKTGIRLFLPRYNFVESIGVSIEDSKLVKFDEANPQHFKKVSPTSQPYSSAPFTMDQDVDVNDLPF